MCVVQYYVRNDSVEHETKPNTGPCLLATTYCNPAVRLLVYRHMHTITHT